MITTCETIWRCWRVIHFALGSQRVWWKYLIMRVILHVCSSHGENVTPRITSWMWRASRWKQFVRWECSFCTTHNFHSSTHWQQLLFNQLYIEWSPSQRQQERRRDISDKRRSHMHIKVWFWFDSGRRCFAACHPPPSLKGQSLLQEKLISPTENPAPESLVMIPLVLLWHCDITLRQRVTHLHNCTQELI